MAVNLRDLALSLCAHDRGAFFLWNYVNIHCVWTWKCSKVNEITVCILKKIMRLFIEWNWRALLVDCMKNEQLFLERYAVWSEKILGYLFICLDYSVSISVAHGAADDVLGWAPSRMLVQCSSWGLCCASPSALTSRLPAAFGSANTRFSPAWCSVRALAERNNQAVGSGDAQRSPDCSGGGPRGAGGAGVCVVWVHWPPSHSACQQPAGLMWCGEKSSHGAGTCCCLKNNHVPLLSLPSPS